MITWTDPMDTILKVARRKEVPFSAIPALLRMHAEISRSACIGRAKRIGLTVPKDRMVAVKGSGSIGRRVAARMKLPLQEPIKVIVESLEFARPWIDRGPKECAWPIEMGERPADTWSCCAPISKGSYCEAHNARMWVTKEERAADRVIAARANQRRKAA